MAQPSIYIASARHISMQQPLTSDWLDAPLTSTEKYVRSIEPDYKQYLSPIKSRRMGKLLKRALVTSIQALRDAGIEQPDAVITGSAWGCLENTELFLRSMCEDGEQLLKPTNFMQSTHNTISSLISIHLGCHGYNTTYSHKNISFESALDDAFMQLTAGEVDNVLVGSHDELTPDWYRLCDAISGRMDVPLTETSVAMVLTRNEVGTMCEVLRPEMLYSPCAEQLIAAVRRITATTGIDLILAGLNGDAENDDAYVHILSEMQGIPVVAFKRFCGENFSASAFATYMAAHLLSMDHTPKNILGSVLQPKSILVVNHHGRKNYSFTQLRKCGNF